MTTWLVGWLGCLAAATTVWCISLVRLDVSIVDVAWGPFFVGLVWWYRLDGPPASSLQLLHAGLVSIWGVRLAAHIWWRSRDEGEDRRYAAMRESIGPSFAQRSLVTVFWLQATLAAALAVPLLATQQAREVSGRLFVVGCALWLLGFALEAVADWQLAAFKRRPDSAGAVLDSGLWRYSRHPNYFGEAVLWWGYGLMAVGVGGWWTLWSPLVVTVLLLRVSGVTLLEKTISSRRPGYSAYVERTSPFVPWPPRRAPAEGGA